MRLKICSTLFIMNCTKRQQPLIQGIENLHDVINYNSDLVYFVKQYKMKENKTVSQITVFLFLQVTVLLILHNTHGVSRLAKYSFLISQITIFLFRKLQGVVCFTKYSFGKYNFSRFAEYTSACFTKYSFTCFANYSFSRF